jgi:DNA-binding MarR family transcriptional regulator
MIAAAVKGDAMTARTPDAEGGRDSAGTDVDAVTTAVLTASRLLVAITARSLAAAEDAVTLPQFRLMVVLATRGPMKLAAVADQLAVNPSTALRMVDRLSAAGMVSRNTNPQVRREIIVRLTDDGRRVVDDVTARRRTEIAAIVARMSPAQRTRLVAALRAFTVAGGEPSAEPPNGQLSPLGWA